MNTMTQAKPLWLGAAFLCLACLPLRAGLIINGGFESGMAGWTRADQIGSDGTFYLQSGTTSPINGFTVPPPPEGSFAAMSDAQGPGSHVMYQDFLVTPSSSYILGFSLYVNNGNGAPNFYTPPTLDFATPALNQRARVDIMTSTATPFSLSAADILQNLFETAPGSPLVSGYTNYQVDVTSLLQGYQGATLRIRFTDVDNVAPLNVGVDNVFLNTSTATVPDGLPWYVPAMAMACVLGFAARRSRRERTASTIG